ncbi:MAG: hypothetical protein IBX61_09150 [Thermoleophilia bacterium]|nr:hypothetical protein [Thermoleophilia bacterium]
MLHPRPLLIILKIALASALVMFAATVLAMGNMNTGGGDWEWSRPDPQGNTILDFDFVDGNTGWAVGSGGVVLKTTDGGSNWISQTPDATCVGVISHGCTLSGVDFINAATGWAVGEYGTVFRTTNGGDSWTKQVLPAPYSSTTLNSVSFINTSVGVAAGNGHVFYTTNGGATWTRSAGPGTSFHYASVQMVTTSIAYAVADSGRIYKTVNNGVSWTQQASNVSNNLSSVFFKDPDNGFAIGGTRLLRTNNGGATWDSNSTTPLSESMTAIAAAGDNLVTVGDNGVILRRNAADNWPAPPDTVAAQLTSVSSGTTSRLQAVGFAPGLNTAFAGGEAGAVTKTSNGGASWSLIAGGDANDILASSFIDADNGWMAGRDGMVIRTGNGGSSWSSDSAGMPAGTSIHGLHFIDANTGFAAGYQGDAGASYKYSSGSWSAMNVPGGTGKLYAVHMTSADEGWAVGKDSTVLATSDGVTWVPATTGIGAGYELNSVDATTATDGWIAGQKGVCPANCQGVILRYNAGGWSETVMGDARFFSDIDMVDASTGYAVGSGGNIYKTANGGANWSPQASPTGKILASVSFLPDGQTGFIAGGDISEGRVLKTTDGGANWFLESVGTNISLNTVATAPAAGPSGFAAFTGGGNGVVLRNVDALPPKPYFFTWYDDAGGDNWVLMSNPFGNDPLTFTLSIGGQYRSLAAHNNGAVLAGQTITPRYPGVLGGPVIATSQTGKPAIVSQRILWPKGGNSIEEVLGTDANKLSSHFYWSWYDESLGSGFSNWILIANPQGPPANPGNQSVRYRIKIGGQLVPGGSGSIAAGSYVTPRFSGRVGGPVEVEACVDDFTGPGNSCLTPARVMASQRVLSGGGTAFNELVGTPAGELSNRYLWTWYDDKEGSNWLLVANHGSGDVQYTIKIGGVPMPGYEDRTLAPGAIETPRFGIAGGPVEVTSTGDVLASQRVIWGPSFGETPGYSYDALSSNYHWTWYDQAEPGVSNWVLVANPSDSNVWYRIYIGGQARNACTALAANDRHTPTFPGQRGGPVEVRAYASSGDCASGTLTPGTKVMASQRVLWKGYFNEVLGTVLE